MLIRLPNGDAVDPETVTGVRFINDPDVVEVCVRIDLRDTLCHIIKFLDPETARAWRDAFIRECNG